MNVDNMRAVANLIELEDRFYYGKWTSGVVDDEDRSGDKVAAAAHLNRCGTTGCVAGWAAHLALREGFVSDADDIDDLATEFLGLNDDEAMRLFYGHHFRHIDNDWVGPWLEVSSVEIAKYMRQVADGEVAL